MYTLHSPAVRVVHWVYFKAYIENPIVKAYRQSYRHTYRQRQGCPLCSNYSGYMQFKGQLKPLELFIPWSMVLDNLSIVGVTTPLSSPHCPKGQPTRIQERHHYPKVLSQENFEITAGRVTQSAHIAHFNGRLTTNVVQF